MGERTRVVVMSRAQAHSFLSNVVDALVQEHRGVEGAGARAAPSFAASSDGGFSTPHGYRVVVRSFSLTRPLPAALFLVCLQVPSR